MEITILISFPPEVGKNCSPQEIQRCLTVVPHMERYTEHQISKRLGCKNSAVYQAVVKFNKSETYINAKEGSSPWKITPRTDFMMKRKVMDSPTCSAKKIRTDFCKLQFSSRI